MPPLAPLPRRVLCLALSATLSLATPAGLAQDLPAPRLPALGDAGTEDLSIGDERRLGEQIMREARRDPAWLDDPVLLAYMQTLWQPLVQAARERGDIDSNLDRQFPWEIFLVRDRSVNAFALPGGYVGVHLGLLAITGNRDQLASVLAHELSHVTQRHIARGVGNARSTSLVGIAGMLLAILAASRANNIDMANAAIMGGQGAALQGQLNFSREMEREADRIGFAVLSGAGFATAGMAQMFERLQGNAAVADSGAFPYLRTHPLTVERISEARNRVLLARTEPQPRASALHALMQARARVLMDPNPQALQRLAGGGTSSPQAADRVAALYSAALAQSALGRGVAAEEQAAQALRLAQTLVPREPEAERVLALMPAEARLASGDGAGAWRALESAAEPAPIARTAPEAASARSTPDAPGAQSTQSAQSAPGAATADAPASALARNDRSLLTLRARAALKWHERDARAAAGAVRTSTEALQTWLSEHGQDAPAWELLAGTSDALGQKLRSLRAAAESRAALGDLAGAIDRLRAAQAVARGGSAGTGAAGGGGATDFIDASIIDTRLRHLLEERRRLALEARQRGDRGDRDDPR
ncbi:MAG: M48 family metalloprotease [Burkholderiales bacterium]|nr:M48 family metalloprotease [Burkholderiales bacterium]